MPRIRYDICRITTIFPFLFILAISVPIEARSLALMLKHFILSACAPEPYLTIVTCEHPKIRIIVEADATMINDNQDLLHLQKSEADKRLRVDRFQSQGLV